MVLVLHETPKDEPGLARRPVAVRLHKEELTIVVDATELAHYTVEYAPNGTQLRDVTHPQLYDTQYRSPQLPLWQFGDADWLKILHLPRHVRKRRVPSDLIQAHLFGS